VHISDWPKAFMMANNDAMSSEAGQTQRSAISRVSEGTLNTAAIQHTDMVQS
jgi:hypothetical protein